MKRDIKPIIVNILIACLFAIWAGAVMARVYFETFHNPIFSRP